ncbi:amidohydrolase family protein [Nocardia nova]|uniref:amidohydrolase family protein n=1 Tax=Nocardia nova TaxID=37330 RepID=UPI0033DA37A9
MLIRDAVVFGSDCTDIRCERGAITECGNGLPPAPGEDDIDARGGWLIPGLHDHHIHLRSLAARTDSIPVGPERIHDARALATRLREAARQAPGHAWIRAVDYHDDVAGAIDRWALDRMDVGRPVRVQHRAGTLWILDSAACALLDVDNCHLPGVERNPDGQATGRLWRMDTWLGDRLGCLAPDPAPVSALAARRGITGFTDATPDLTRPEVGTLAAAVLDGRIVQRVCCMAEPDIEDPRVERFRLGPTKILLDDATLPELDDFVVRLRRLHSAGRAAAVHCVTRVQLVLTMAAFDLAGTVAGDRIEHGAVIPPEALTWLRRNDIPVITQPHFLIERAAQYARDVPAEDQGDLWRLGSLLAAGVGTAAGTDAPFGDPDPWAVVRAAVDRGPDRPASEALSPATALSLFFGTATRPHIPRTIATGHAADLTLLRVGPHEVADVLDQTAVAATIIAGEVAYRTD